MIKRWIWALAVVCSTTGSLLAQSQSSAPEEGAVKLPEFAVVSVRPTPDDAHSGIWKVTPDGISSRNPASWLVVAGFGLLRSDRVIGLPEWASNDWYDVEARVDERDVEAFKNLKHGQEIMTLRSILVDRFKLKYHFETRMFSVLALTVVKASPGLVVAAPTTPEHPQGTWHYDRAYLVYAYGFSMQNLANIVLSSEVPHLVEDHTGLPGLYDFSLDWCREDVQGKVHPPGCTAPGIEQALQEQLGLKLVSMKVPVRVLVVDAMERPAAN